MALAAPAGGTECSVPSTARHALPLPPPQNVAEKQRACETDLAKAEPALVAAQEALNTLNKVRESTAL